MITVPKSNIREMNPHPSMKEIGGDVDRYVIDSTRWSICSTNAIISITVREFVIRVYNTVDFYGDKKWKEIKKQNFLKLIVCSSFKRRVDWREDMMWKVEIPQGREDGGIEEWTPSFLIHRQMWYTQCPKILYWDLQNKLQREIERKTGREK